MLRRILTVGITVGLLSAVGVFFNGCSGSGSYEDGMLYFVNNTRPMNYEELVYAIFEEEETLIPTNMTVDAQLTGAGAILLTDEPLVGGTRALSGAAASCFSSAPRLAPTKCMMPCASRNAATATRTRITAQKWRLSSLSMAI